MNPIDVLQAQRDRVCALLVPGGAATDDPDDLSVDGDGSGIDLRDRHTAARRELERFLDMEERVLAPRLDDLLVTRGPEVDDAANRRIELRAALHRWDEARGDDAEAAARRLADLLHAHVERSDRDLLRRLRLEADELDFQALGAALEEARLSAAESDVPLHPPVTSSEHA